MQLPGQGGPATVLTDICTTNLLIAAQFTIKAN
jgi:hypothetical protein